MESMEVRISSLNKKINGIRVNFHKVTCIGFPIRFLKYVFGDAKLFYDIVLQDVLINVLEIWSEGNTSTK